jgi:hypothetical protein
MMVALGAEKLAGERLLMEARAPPFYALVPTTVVSVCWWRGCAAAGLVHQPSAHDQQRVHPHPTAPCVCCDAPVCVCQRGLRGALVCGETDWGYDCCVWFGGRGHPAAVSTHTPHVLCTLQLHCDPMLHATCCCRPMAQAEVCKQRGCALLGVFTVNLLLIVAVCDGQLRVSFAHTCAASCCVGKACGLWLADHVTG